jgi:REP element-mobilizing transposase RayT
MARRIRGCLAGHLVEITTRTLQGRFLLKPSPQANASIKGVLGRAQRRTGMKICACVFLSNHYHLLVVPESEHQLAEFMEFLNSNIARQLGRLHGWR